MGVARAAQRVVPLDQLVVPRIIILTLHHFKSPRPGKSDTTIRIIEVTFHLLGATSHLKKSPKRQVVGQAAYKSSRGPDAKHVTST